MYYHFAILLLFRPFIKLKFVGSSVLARDVCCQAADAIAVLLNSYSKLYTLRRTPSFVPYFVLSSSITHLVAIGNAESKPAKFLQAIADLKEMRDCHGFARKAFDILRFLIHDWDIKISLDDLEDGGFHPKDLCLPLPTSLNQFCPNIQHDHFKNCIKPLKSLDKNPLFWPFPLQGRPLVAVGDQLRHAGFALLES